MHSARKLNELCSPHFECEAFGYTHEGSQTRSYDLQHFFEQHAISTKMQSIIESRLCDTCTTIPFRQLHENGKGESQRFSLLVGNVSDVRDRKHCPFCQLIFQGLSTSDRLLDTANVEIYWKYPGFYRFHSVRFPVGSQIAFFDEKNTRLIDNNGIDISRIRQWLSVCSDRHSSCSLLQYTPDDEILNFRVIDVFHKCITIIPRNARYIALSYVWGQVGTYRLLKGNMRDLMKPKGLSRVWEHVPLTIRDAISFTEAIGERYLWVDTLCLIQDDDNDKIPGIKHMDVVFGQAFCTIIAAGGDDANAGLPGVGDVPRRQQHTSEIRPGIRLILEQGMEVHMNQTQYIRRAWT